MLNKKTLPNLVIKNPLSKTVTIKERFNFFPISIFFIKSIFGLIVLSLFFMFFTYAKVIYEENNYLKEKLITDVASSQTEESNMLLDTFSNIISREGKINNDMAHNYAKWIFENAYEQKVDPVLILAIISVESQFDFKAMSNANAVGLMQVIYIWHKEKVNNKSDLFDPKTNIRVGTKIIKEYLERSSTEVEALLRYNGSLGKSPIYSLKVAEVKQRFNFEILRKFTQKS
jgi:hypothetical protein